MGVSVGSPLILLKTARDLVSEGEALLKFRASLNANRADLDRFQSTKIAWRNRFTELIEDEALQDAEDSKAIKGVPASISQRLWEIDDKLAVLK